MAGTDADSTRAEGAVVRHGSARFTVVSPVCVRLEHHPRGAFVDAPSLFAGNRDAGWSGYELTVHSRNPQRITIDTGVMRLIYNDNGLPFCGENINVFFDVAGVSTFWDPNARNLDNLGGTATCLDGRRGPVALEDGLLARDGWRVIDDSATPLLVDDWVEPRPADAGTDWYLFVYGRDYRAAMRALTAVGGAVPLPRKYALGSWYSRWHAYTSDEYRNLVDEYDAHGYPLDVLVWDMDWHRKDARSGRGWANTLGWTGFSFNRELLPDAEKLIDELAERGIAVTLNVHPHDGIREHEDAYPGFMRDLGKDPERDAPSAFDAGDKRYMDAYFRHGHAPHEDAGVAFWWVDWQQDTILPEVPGVPGLGHLRWLNELYFRHARRNGRRGLGFSRWGGWGDHRHPIHFSGDAFSTWRMLAFQVPFTAVSGNVGCFFWSHDMGGFMGELDDELYARWLQFGALSAAMRLHGIGSDRRPWTWAEWAQPAMRKSFELRSRLLPYTYSSAAQSCRESVPLCRPMYLDEPEREAAYASPQQYRYGDHLLVAPIASPGTGPGRVAAQAVDPPAGRWFNLLTGERLDGPGERLVAAELDEMPVYARGGVPIPEQPFRLRPATARLDELVVRCFPGADGEAGTFTLYEDDGVSRAHESGAYRTTPLTYRRDGDRIAVRVGAAEGSFADMVERRPVRVELPCTGAPADVRIDGEPASAEHDAAARTTTVRVAERSVREGVEITLTAPDADPGAIAREAALRRAERLTGERAPADTVAGWAAAKTAAGDETQAGELLRALGVGVHEKDESPRGDGTRRLKKLYAPADLLDDARLRLVAEAPGASDPSALFEAELAGPSAFPCPLPEAAARDASYRVACRIGGHPIEARLP